jgi:heptosyltransferase I
MRADVFEREIRSVAIVMLSAIGDAVHVLPVACALKRKDPDLRITWVIQPVPHRLVRGHPAVDDFVLFRRRAGWGQIGALRSAVEELRQRRFDLVLGLQVYLKAGLLLWGSRADIKLGFDRRRARDANWLFSTHRIPAHAPGHVQDQYFEFVRHLGVEPEPVEWRLELTEREARARNEYFAALPRPACGFVVATSKREKNWFPDRYARLIEIAAADLGLHPILLGGPSVVEQEMALEIMRLVRVPVASELGDDLRRLLYLIDGCSVVVSPDTGPLHIARALDRPVVGLYGYTNPKRTGPYRRFTDLVADGYARFPGEPYPLDMHYRRDGMARVSVEMAAGKLELAVKDYVKAGA